MENNNTMLTIVKFKAVCAACVDDYYTLTTKYNAVCDEIYDTMISRYDLAEVLEYFTMFSKLSEVVFDAEIEPTTENLYIVYKWWYERVKNDYNAKVNALMSVIADMNGTK